jgi:hypothetical protein
MKQLVLRRGQTQDSGAGGIALSRVWTLIFCLPRGAVDPRILRRAFKRWAGGRQRGRPFKDGGQLISAARDEPSLCIAKQISRPPSSSTCVPARESAGEGSSPVTAFAAHEGRAGERADRQEPGGKKQDDVPDPRRRL